MNSKVFTVHLPFTTYHFENYNKNHLVNSVNSFSKKKFFLCLNDVHKTNALVYMYSYVYKPVLVICFFTIKSTNCRGFRTPVISANSFHFFYIFARQIYLCSYHKIACY
ncbi:hypothetical protein C3709_20730 [Lelliottia aquatilis]|uniref:Uncharacterized protein n=1 Tax=Lelliottia aquatilis TaxID=2080838 RepID=A0ABX4ZWW5_9ENTR|nr:hypothetical protein C3712_21050 [Lelliottia aquatilis]POZ20996.1 hypothetical protein C3711_21370 [Lelliottia aquatilis]POZ24433.1 hypothetical protein C3708_14545 [Lelliottia sp. 7254-16]POZ30682.1 hypothetical protein C3710_21335 [Lelliottia aquatilis]POZ36374.1 hypothetical protein C3709_20730 [Lelliottia aquatilis]